MKKRTVRKRRRDGGNSRGLVNRKPTQRSEFARDRALHVVAAMRRDPNLSLSQAAKLEGVKPETVKKHFSSSLRKVAGKFTVTKSDRRSATLYLPDAHGNPVPLPTRSSKERMQASNYLRDLGAFNLVVDDCPDVTGRTCTRKDTKTGVLVDFLTGGIRITERALLGSFEYSDPLPIPEPSGFGDVASLNTLIAMKVGAITSGLDTRALGANCGGREPDEVQQDIDDVRKLISVCQLPRNLELGSASVQRDYEKIYDGDSFIPELLGVGRRPLPSK